VGMTALWRALTTMVALGTACAAVLQATPARAAGDATATSCGSATEASPGFRPYLPDCRAYELVTPPYKAGAVLLAEPGAIATDGARLIVGAAGAFAGVGNLWFNPNRNANIAAYELARTGTGWQPTALTPSAETFHVGALAAASSPSFQTTVWTLSSSELIFNENVFLRSAGEFKPVGPGVAPEVANEALPVQAEELSLVGGSNDLMHSVFAVESESTGTKAGHHEHSNLWPGDPTVPEAFSLYEYHYSGSPISEPRLVGVKNSGVLKNNGEAEVISACGTELGSGFAGSAFNAVSDDGGTVVFTAHSCSGAPPVDEVYARLGGAETVDISEPSSSDCESCNTSTELANAVYAGAASDGSKAFFVTAQPLLPGQTGASVYEYDFNAPGADPEHPAGKISLVSPGVANPEVQGVVRVSNEGSTVYFVAKGILTGANAEGHEPQPEADNLYVSRETGVGAHEVAFVGTLLTPTVEASLTTEEAEESTIVAELAEKAATTAFEEAFAKGDTFEEAAGVFASVLQEKTGQLTGTLGPGGTLTVDKSVWQARDERPAQTTPNGQSLVFLSSEDLTPDDTSKVPQLFAYDALTEHLSRISTGQRGSFNNDGNVIHFVEGAKLPSQNFAGTDRPTTPYFRLALSEDGTRVVFRSAARLTPEAETGATNVYEHEGGNQYLISSGHDSSRTDEEASVELYGIDPSGTDVFFTTADPLVPQAADSTANLYDARIEGGFPAAATAGGCDGETCRGASAEPPQTPGPGSATQAAGDNSTSVHDFTPPKLTKAQRLKKALQACRRRHKRRVPRLKCERQARRTILGATAQSRRGAAHSKGVR
jgi:hypothetical protein